MNYRYSVAIGDWSDDGHGKCEHFHYETSHDIDEIREAYKKAVKASGVALEDGSKADFVLFSEYDEHTMPGAAVERLESIGVDFSVISGDPGEDEFYDDEKSLRPTSSGLANMFMEMVRTQIEEFQYKKIENQTISINGYWSKFNESIGYGLYS